ncbi:MAG: tetratricopeptide repeat protein [Campylobacterota bacterium]|nr:tetratricopeptide repeat protein [Campylobacterota bacterium]
MFNTDIFDYRDPIYGLMVIVAFIFVASFITYTIGIYKERVSRKEYRKLLKRFELGTLKEDDYIHLYNTYNLPFDSIILLASSFLHKGENNKAISVYLALLELVNEPVKKEELLELLGKTYFKSGMLQRSKDIYLKILKFRPRNKNALRYLLLIFQNLKEYRRALEVLDALDEIEEDIEFERLYLIVLEVMDDSILSFEKKSTILYDKYLLDNKLERLVVSFLIKFNKELFWNNIEKFNYLNIIDTLWYLDFDDINWDKVSDINLLQEIYSAKGYISDKKDSNIFELNVLIATKNSTTKTAIDLNFEFICKSCKKNHPIYESRCPHCHEILTLKVEPKLGKSLSDMASFV